MNEHDVEELVNLCVAAALPEPPSETLTSERCAHFYADMLSNDEKSDVLASAIASDEAAEILEECGRQWEMLRGKADVDLRTAALEGGCRAAVAGVLLDLRRIRKRVGGETITIQDLIASVKNAVMSRGQARGILASRDVPSIFATTRSGRRVATHKVEGNKVAIDISASTGKGYVCLYPSMVVLAEVGPDSASLELDLADYPELAELLRDDDQGLQLVVVEG